MYIKCSNLNIKNHENTGIVNKQYINLDKFNSKINKFSICANVIVNIIFILFIFNKQIQKFLRIDSNVFVVLIYSIIDVWVVFILYDVLDKKFGIILINCIAMFFTLYFVVRFSISNGFGFLHLGFYMPFSLYLSMFCIAGVLLCVINVMMIFQKLFKLDKVINFILVCIVISILSAFFIVPFCFDNFSLS